MKVLKGFVLFSFLLVGISSCFNPPEFAITPKISFNSIQFKVTPGASNADSLILFIDFKDGDGDLGLNDSYKTDPYHERNFYFESAGNTITPVGTVLQNVNKAGLPSQIPMIVTTPTGKLVTNRTRNKPGYDYLPEFKLADVECRNYTVEYLLIAPSAASAVDASYNIVDSLYGQGNPNPFLLLKDTAYFEKNLNHYNIIVRFYESSGGPFTEYRWEEQFCTTFNGRFPILSTSEKSSPLEGTIRYAMTSTGFTAIFGVKNLKLDVIVKDRALNKDSIQTPAFTLDRIRVN